MTKLHKFLAVLGLAAAGLTLPAEAASAASVSPTASHAHQVPTAPPAGYSVIETGPFTAPAGVQTPGIATCPGTKQPTGGGAYTYDNNTSVDINDSWPSGHSWVVDVNNNQATDTKFVVWVMCMRASAGYHVVSAPGYANAGATDYASVSCPSKTVVVGGGAIAGDRNLGVAINSSVGNRLGPGQTEWTAAMTNTSSSADAFSVLAVCRPKPLGYTIVHGSQVSVAPGATAEITAGCPGLFSVPLSGGGFTTYQVTDSGLAFNSSFPGTGDWATLWENSGSITRSVAASVICAGT